MSPQTFSDTDTDTDRDTDRAVSIARQMIRTWH